MPTGYSGTPLRKKLGIKDGMRVVILHEPDGLRAELGPLDGVAELSPAARDLDFVLMFLKERRSLAELVARWKKRIRSNGMVWVGWPKRASKVPTDITEDVVREVALSEGMVDVKVCAIDQVWSGLKLVYRLRDRP